MENEWIETPDSSSLEAYRYQQEARELTIRFRKGQTHTYPCSQETFFAFQLSRSRGQFVNRVLKAPEGAVGKLQRLMAEREEKR